MHRLPMIYRFQDRFDFLSNFHPAPLIYKNIEFPTAEHAFQWSKCMSVSEAQAIRDAPTPSAAKKIGHTVSMRRDWATVRFSVMYKVVREKFAQNDELADRLKRTGDAVLVEGNIWHDTTWGKCLCPKHDGEGANALGAILMMIRAELVV